MIRCSKLIEWSQKNRMEISFELIHQGCDSFNSPTFETEVLIEGIHAGKGMGYSKKESQQIAAHESLNLIKKDAAFMEKVFAAKTVRGGDSETIEVFEEKPTAAPQVETAVIEELKKPTDRESIISAAEEAAFQGLE